MNPGLEALKSRAVPVLRSHGVVRAAVFGSFARGEQDEDSDLDLLVEFEERRSLLDLVGLCEELPKAVGRPVDVVTYDAIAAPLRDRVLNEQVKIL